MTINSSSSRLRFFQPGISGRPGKRWPMPLPETLPLEIPRELVLHTPWTHVDVMLDRFVYGRVARISPASAWVTR